jgi:hypothetical protein
MLSRQLELSSYSDTPKDQPIPYQAARLEKTDNSMRFSAEFPVHTQSVLTINSSDDSLLITTIFRNPNATQHHTYPILPVTPFAESAKDRAT